jgi:hypothetical protein
MSECSRCGKAFSCAMRDGAGDADAACWCTQLPFLPRAQLPDESEPASCFCPDCLKAWIAEVQGGTAPA